MPLIIVDGPEKAGKTTLVQHLADTSNAVTRKFYGAADPDDRVYMEQLAYDMDLVANGRIVVWDRSWASEVVYGRLLGQDRRIAGDAWLARWLYGRCAEACGTRVMLLGPGDEELEALRDDTDLPVPVGEERLAFRGYALVNEWWVFQNRHTAGELGVLAKRILNAAVSRDDTNRLPPTWAGPLSAEVVFVGQDRKGAAGIGAWLPFSSRLTTTLAREYEAAGGNPFSAAWTNSSECPPQSLRGAEVVVACGDIAQRWVRHHVNHPNVVDLRHPSWLYRYVNGKTDAEKKETAKILRDIVRRYS